MLVVHHIRRPRLTFKVRSTLRPRSKKHLQIIYGWSYLRTICGYLRILLWIRVLPGCFYDTPCPQQSEKESEIHKTCHAAVTKSTKTAGSDWGVQDKRLPDCLKPAWSRITTISFARATIVSPHRARTISEPYIAHGLSSMVGSVRHPSRPVRQSIWLIVVSSAPAYYGYAASPYGIVRLSTCWNNPSTSVVNYNPSTLMVDYSPSTLMID